MIVICVGMVKAGSAWYFNMTNDLLVAAGHQDVREIRQRFHLHSALKHQNCLLAGPPASTLLLLIPHFLGNSFAIKAHGAASTGRRLLVNSRIAKATYIYRDPRDVVVSVFERGQEKRATGRTGSFTQLDSIETTVQYVLEELEFWDEWMRYNKALPVRYEELIADTVGELERLADFLSLDVSPEKLGRIADTYRPKNQPSTTQSGVGLHFNKGIVGRYRQVLTPEEQNLCREHFGEYLQRMGYE